MINLYQWKPLLLNQDTQPGRGAFLSAASSIVRVNNFLYVIADDENSLGIFPLGADEPGSLHKILPENLPLELQERKAQKADFESLVAIAPAPDFPQGALIALGSGSKKMRQRAVILPFECENKLADRTLIADLGPLYDALSTEIGKLNIEGALIVDENIWLFQRGNKKNRFNGSIRLPLTQFLAWILPDRNRSASNPTILRQDLGKIAGVPLCFTDATLLPNGNILFSAASESAAEDGSNTKNFGSALGALDREGNILWVEPVAQPVKLEGICSWASNAGTHVLLVSDADRASTPANFYLADIASYFT